MLSEQALVTGLKNINKLKKFSMKQLVLHDRHNLVFAGGLQVCISLHLSVKVDGSWPSDKMDQTL